MVHILEMDYADPDFDIGPLPETPLIGIEANQDERGDGEEKPGSGEIALVLADLSGTRIAEDDASHPLMRHVLDILEFREVRTSAGYEQRAVTRKISTSEPVKILRNLGWRVRTTAEYVQAVKHFQGGYNIGTALVVDGAVGPKTLAALRQSDARRKAHLPTASAHFSFTEYQCRCGGAFSNCARVWVTRRNLAEIEQYRKGVGQGVAIVSGCRCPGHNKAVGGATASQHLLGKATDFAPLKPVAWFTEHEIYKPGGLGANPAKLVRHGDVGPDRGWNYQS